MTSPLRAVPDSHVLDFLLADPEAMTRLSRACATGAVVLLGTHLLADELVAMLPDKQERWECLDAIRRSLCFEHVPTYGFVLDVSRLDLAALHDDAAAGRYDTATHDNPRHAEDALLMLTAEQHHAVFVTDDKKATGKARTLGIEVLTPREFIDRLPL